MVINSNLPALAAASQLEYSSSWLAHSLHRLAAGTKITSADDDSAGLAVSMKLNAQLARLSAVSNNLGNAISFTQTQDGYLQKVGEALTRMNELAVRALDPTLADVDRADYHLENEALGVAIRSIVNQDFNGVSLFSGQNLPVTIDGEGHTFSFGGVDGQALVGFAAQDSLVNFGDARLTLSYLKTAMNAVAASRAMLGATLESLGYHSEQAEQLKYNLSAANSRITDVDVAQESTRYAKYNILVQASTAMLAQANTQPQAMLKLLSGS